MHTDLYYAAANEHLSDLRRHAEAARIGRAAREMRTRHDAPRRVTRVLRPLKAVAAAALGTR